MANGSSPAVVELANHVRDSLVDGKFGKFVPLSKLQSFYSKEYIIPGLLKAFRRPPGTKSTIHNSFQRVFTILVLIGKADFIEDFILHDRLADADLPFRNVNDWPPSCRDFFESFKSKQWQFCPRNFDGGLMNPHLDDQLILPIIKAERIGKGGNSRTFLVEIHPEYNNLANVKAGTQKTNKFVLKTSRGSKCEESYLNEVNAYTHLIHKDDRNYSSEENDVAKHMVKLYASWRQNGEYNLLLEYADKGSLEEYFDKTKPPLTEEGFSKFWENLLQLIKPLQRIHELTEYSHGIFSQGIHQDITPANILVASGPSDYDVTFKLADFGLTRFEPKSRDRCGTQMYSAPENLRDERFLQRCIIPSKPSSDIWSLGCVLSEAAVWSNCGKDGLEEYLSLRKQEIQTDCDKGLEEAGYSGCFHNGLEALNAVERTHSSIRDTHRRTDHSVCEIITLVEEMLGDDADLRPTALQLHRRFRPIIKNAKDRLPPPKAVASPNSFLGSVPYPDIFRTNSNDDASQALPLRLPPNLPPDCVPELSRRPGLGIHMFSDASVAGIVNGSHADLGTSPRLAARRYKDEQVRPIDYQPSSSQYPGSSSKDRTESGLNGTASQNRPPSPRITPRKRTNSSSFSGNHISPGGAGSLIPDFSMDYVYRWIQEKEKMGRNSKKKFAALPGYEEIIGQLDDRDQIFLIDNSASMIPHFKAVVRVFEVLSYLTNPADPDGMELYFTRTKKGVHNKDRDKLIRVLKKTRVHGRCNMKNRLDRILEKWIENFEKSKKKRRFLPLRKKKDGVNIYVFTDGVWRDRPTPLCGVEKPIRDIVNRLSRREVSADHVGIEFIRFGNDELGTKRLDQLDSGLSEFDVKEDIVDTEPSDGNVLKMLLGSFDAYWDNDSNSSTPVRHSSGTLTLKMN